MGSEQKWAVMSQLERIMEHLLKLQYSPSPQARRQWMISVIGARGEIERRITATIRREVEPEVPKLYARARRTAGLALMDHGEAHAAGALPADCPYGLDQLIAEDWWPVNRHGLTDE